MKAGFEGEKADPTLIKAGVNQKLRELFGVHDQPYFKPGFTHYEAIEGGSPEIEERFKVGERVFGAEYYLPLKERENGVWVVTQHGYGGRARDFSKLAELLKKEGVGLLSLDMHITGKDDYERMSMNIDEWANVAIEARNRLRDSLKEKGKRIGKLIFVGQSSGGSSGASLLVNGKDRHPFSGAVLIGPTLTTVHPELVESMDKIVDDVTSKEDDVMIDFGWFGPLMRQCNDEDRNFAYQAHFATLPGFPYRHAREAIAIDKEKILDRIDSIDVPTILVKGKEDNEDIASIKAVAEVLSANPNQSIHIEEEIEGAGHQAELDKPEVIARLIEKLANS